MMRRGGWHGLVAGVDLDWMNSERTGMDKVLTSILKQGWVWRFKLKD